MECTVDELSKPFFVNNLLGLVERGYPVTISKTGHPSRPYLCTIRVPNLQPPVIANGDSAYQALTLACIKVDELGLKDKQK